MFLIILTLCVLILPFLYDSYTSFRYYARFYVYYAYVMVAAIVLLPIMACRPKDVSNLLLSAKVCRLVSGLIGLRWTVKGMEHLSRERNTACVMVANHQSSLDILGMFEIWHVMGKVTVVAKRELMFAGTFGIAAWLCNLIFIDRTNPTSAKDVINKAMETMVPQNTKLWVFPEGTRRNTGIIHPFKKGAFSVAIKNKLPIIPVVFSQYYFLDSRCTEFEPGEIIITVLPKVDTMEWDETKVDELVENVKLSMTKVFQAGSQENIILNNHNPHVDLL